jgi:hypothetical protein
MSDEILAVVNLSETILEANFDQNGPPQDVSPTATPVFNSVALTSLTEGQLVYVGPGKVLIPLTLGPNLSITEGSLVVEGGGEGGGGNGTGIQEGDPRLTDAREWSAPTMTTETAAAGVGTARLATTAAVLRAAAAGWWDATSGALGKLLAGASTAAQGRTLLELGSAAQAATSDFVSASDPYAGLATLLTGGAKQLVLFNGATGYTNGTGATADVSNGSSSGTKPNFGTFSTGSTATGFAGLSVIPLAVGFNNSRGRYALASFARFRFNCTVWIPVLSSAADSFACHFGLFADNGNYAQRRAVGAILLGNAIYAVATAGGVSVLSPTFATVTADTAVYLDVEFTGTELIVRVNNGAALSVNSGFPTDSPLTMNAGVFISKTGGTVGTTPSILQVANGSYLLAQLALP